MQYPEDFTAWSKLYSAWRAAYRGNSADEAAHYRALVDWVEAHGYAGSELDPRRTYEPDPCASPDAIEGELP